MRTVSLKVVSRIALAAVCFAVSLGSAAAQSLRSFESNGRSVRVDEFRAHGGGRGPAVMILHGASGLGDGTLLYPLARDLADRGINAYVVRYFDGLAAPAPNVRPAATNSRQPTARQANTRQTSARAAPAQRPARTNFASPGLHASRDRVLTDALSFIRRQPHVDGNRIGLFGLSLGGFHTLDIASRDRSILAAVSFVGAMPGNNPEDRSLAAMPPTLLLHGTNDRIVPFQRVQRLYTAMQQAGAPVQMTTFRGAGHSFRGSDLVRAHDQAATFLEAALLGRGVTTVATRPY
ncbi:MAG: dienelactone hydrolase family protein [Alphaproteobacteria bacterium]|nr:dienelactone hydrolase family protein [Alphaproteobacteria bacterium]